MLYEPAHPVLGAVGVDGQRVDGVRRAGYLGLDLPAHQAVGHALALAHRQDLQPRIGGGGGESIG